MQYAFKLFRQLVVALINWMNACWCGALAYIFPSLYYATSLHLLHSLFLHSSEGVLLSLSFYNSFSFSSSSASSLHSFISHLLFIPIAQFFIFLTSSLFLQAEMQRQRDQCATLKSNLLISDSDLKTRITELEIVKNKYGFTHNNKFSQKFTTSIILTTFTTFILLYSVWF